MNDVRLDRVPYALLALPPRLGANRCRRGRCRRSDLCLIHGVAIASASDHDG